MVEPSRAFGATLTDRYRIERELGTGGMAVVYLAHDVRHDRHVALKVLRDEVGAALGPERFLQEIRTTARLQHPHILPLLDSGEADGRLFYVMPYVAGETLRERLEREHTIPIPEVARLTSQLAAALESAHRRGVIHRDIKPENILLTEGLPLLADFGIALAVQHAGGDRLTTVGVSLGTPAYMSPEQVVATREIDGRTDLYSLACIVFEAIAGRPPYRGATPFATMAEHVSAAIPPLTSPAAPVPPALANAVRRALAKDPGDRFATVSAFADAVTAAVAASRSAGSSTNEKSIVVLPFDNLSADPNDAYLAGGLTEELTADLARVGALRVTARNSAVAAKERTRDVREIAKLLGTRYVLEGSVRRAGNALRITAQLIDGETDAHLWSEKYGGTMDDVFAMQERISRMIVDALAVTLSATERSDLEARPIANLEAYQLYLQVRQCLQNPLRESIERARGLLVSALRLTGENHVLIGLQGVVEVMEFSLGYGTADSLTRADASASRSLGLHPRSAPGLYAKAMVAEKSNLAVSVHYLRQAAAADPASTAMGLLAIGLAVRGEDDALQCARWAAERDPLSPVVLGWAAMAAWYSAALSDAIAWADATVRIAPDSPWTCVTAGYVLAGAGKTYEALALLDRGSAATGEPFFVGFCTVLAQAMRRQPVAHLDPALTAPLRLDPHGSQILAEVYAFGGDRHESLGWLRNAVSLGVVNAAYMAERSPFLAPLRGDPEFEAVVAEARARRERERATAS
jgi:serine/threonine-protein kinase